MRPLTPDEQEVVLRFAKLWWDRGAETVFCRKWLGIPALQNPFDAWATQEIISEVRPEVIVESGSFVGGSALLWAMILEQVRDDGRVIAIDTLAEPAQTSTMPLFRRRVEWITGSSTEPAVVDEVRRRCDGRTVMVILDSDHAADHVAAELDAYADLVTVGSYLIAEDGLISSLEPEHGPGPAEAVAEFLARDDRFEVDGDRERMLFTVNPGGFLRRVR